MIRRIEFGTPVTFKGKSVFNLFIPEECPLCHYKITPDIVSKNVVVIDLNTAHFALSLFCPNCKQMFIADYGSGLENPRYIAPQSVPTESFDPSIQSLSEGFVRIYNQAYAAESYKLDEIAGMGYRKALEYLIKDFIISMNPEDAETVKKMELGNCIANKLNNPRLQSTAARAAWIGNDFTHYTRKFTEYDISDLKRFIKAVLYWIMSELTTDEADSLDRR